MTSLCCSYKEEGPNPSFGAEICVKLTKQLWVVGRKVNLREVYVVIMTKSGNLLDVMDEVNKLISREFKNVCMLEK